MKVAVTALAACEHPNAFELQGYFKHHISEEAGHEEWVLQDFQTLGISRSTVCSQTPSSNIAAAVGAQYYWIHHFSPLTLLGYIAVIEGYPPTHQELTAYSVSTGLPVGAFSTLFKHAELDKRHGADLDRLLDRLTLSDADMRLIGTSAYSVIKHLASEVQAIGERSFPRHDFQLQNRLATLEEMPINV